MHLDALRSTHPIRAEVRNVTPEAGGELRPHHLREGRRGPAHDRGLPRRGAVPRRHPARTCGGTRRGTPSPTSCGRALGGGVAAAGARARRTPGSGSRGSRSSRCAREGRGLHAGAAEVLLGAGRGGRAPRAKRSLAGAARLPLRGRRGGVKEQRHPPARARRGEVHAGRARARWPGSARTPARPGSTGSLTTRPGSRRSRSTSRGSRRRSGSAPLRRVGAGALGRARGGRLPRPGGGASRARRTTPSSTSWWRGSPRFEARLQ